MQPVTATAGRLRRKLRVGKLSRQESRIGGCGNHGRIVGRKLAGREVNLQALCAAALLFEARRNSVLAATPPVTSNVATLYSSARPGFC